MCQFDFNNNVVVSFLLVQILFNY